MKRVKVLGPSNDAGVHEVELNLAKIVQNAKARNLSWTKNTAYRYANGKRQPDGEYDDMVTKCCAIGAAWLEPDTENLSVDIEANDNGFSSLYDGLSTDYLDDRQLLGLGFRLAMR